MRAAVLREFTGPDCVHVEEFDLPAPGPGQVRVRLAAAGVNNSDLQTSRGSYARSFEPPLRMGQEGAGTVDAVGPEVASWRPGDRVCGHLLAAFAEYALAPADELVRVPDGVDLVDAAGIPIAYLTAGIGLVYQCRVQPGEWVLVQAASGGVGTAAVQLARSFGAKVIATAGSAEKLAKLKTLGAEEVIDYSDMAAVAPRVMEITGGRGFDVGMDGAGEKTFQALLECLGNNGRIALYGTVTGRPQGGAERIFRQNGALHGIVLWTNRYYKEAYKLLIDPVLEGLASGRVRSMVENVFPLDRLPEALKLMDRREQFGKIVVTP